MRLTNKEKELIVSALVFTASGDVCIDITKADRKTLVGLAKKFGPVKVTTAYVYGPDKQFDDPTIVKSIIKNFDIRREGN